MSKAHAVIVCTGVIYYAPQQYCWMKSVFINQYQYLDDPTAQTRLVGTCASLAGQGKLPSLTL